NGTAVRTFIGGGLTYNAVSISANSNLGGVSITGSSTIGTLSVAAPGVITIGNATTTTITNAFTLTGTSSNFISLIANGAATISIASGTAALTWGAVRGLAFSGGATFTFTNTIDLGGNSGASISAPSFGGSGGAVFSRISLGM